MHPSRVPVGVQRRLRKTKIDIWSFAGAHQLRRKKMIALIPGESPLLGVDQECSCVERHHSNQPTVSSPAIPPGTCETTRIHDCKLWHKFAARRIVKHRDIHVAERTQPWQRCTYHPLAESRR